MTTCVLSFTHVLCALAYLTLFSVINSSSYSTDFYAHRIKRQTKCSQTQFQCSDGQCTASYNVCDGAKDCSDGSDEIEDTCRALHIRCPALAYECSYGACVDKTARCDGKTDCADESDELGCSTNATCPSGSFKCASGQCVDQYAVCDGASDCSDGSDETRDSCQGLKCPSGSFQCDYGACLEQSVRCNGSSECPDSSDEAGCGSPDTTRLPPGGCRLPSHPRFGVYVSSQCQPGDARAACRNTPGTPVPANWLLKYSCNANYDLSSAGNEYSVCDNGQWNNRLDCIKLCQPLQSLSVDVRCVYKSREVSCDRPMKPGTWARASCKQHYAEKYKPEYSRLTCLPSGEWSNRLFYCVPECGVSIEAGSVMPLILNGNSTRAGEYPWLVALYLRKRESEVTEGKEWDQQCGGTLITPHIVLTAAHCLVFYGVPIKPQDVRVGLGKYYRDFYKEENSSVIVNVREVVVPQYYSGEATFYALDIALLDLETSVRVSAYIRPACVDWTLSNVYSNHIGHVSGWGTTENGTSSETVLSTQLQYLDNAACIRRVRLAYKSLLTHDKFCAESNNGSQVDKGDSGGGLTAVKTGQHFVIGVVSTKIRAETSFSLFTNISNTEHFSWLEDNKIRLENLHREM